jgi:tungstate transport system substrate-binding protein
MTTESNWANSLCPQVGGVRLSVALIVLVVAALGCSGAVDSPSTGVLRLATTTSTRDSGLLERLLPRFEKANACRVDVVAVGTGAALKLGEAGDVDVVVVHAREAEEAFMKSGHGIRHEEFMDNHFILLGPPSDPAGIRDVDPVEALRKIHAGSYPFVSRGDDSGTHKRELRLWKAAKVEPQGDAYVEAGSGMGPTLVMASEMRAYVLADMGTYLNFRDKIDLLPLAKSTAVLRNPYAAMVVNPDKHHRIDQQLAEAFVDFLISAEAQQVIANYKIGEQQLFHPTRLEDQSP